MPITSTNTGSLATLVAMVQRYGGETQPRDHLAFWHDWSNTTSARRRVDLAQMNAGWNDFVFVDAVAHHFGATVKGRGRERRLRGRNGRIDWELKASSGGSSGESSFRWSSASYRLDSKAMIRDTTAAMKAGRTPQPSLMLIVRSRVIGVREALNPLAGPAERWSIEDPRGILDDQLRHRVQTWPDAYVYPHRDPREVTSVFIATLDHGVEINSDGWWGSEATLTHLVMVGVDVTEALLGASELS